MAERVKLHYEEYGSGQVILLLHGFPLNRTIWAPLRTHLQSHARVILPDLRGHGLSPTTAGISSMDALAEDVVALMDDLQLERVLLAGHSMGGYVALALAQAHPQRLSGLALIASTPFADPPEQRLTRYEQAEIVRQTGISSLANSMALTLTLDSA